MLRVGENNCCFFRAADIFSGFLICKKAVKHLYLKRGEGGEKMEQKLLEMVQKINMYLSDYILIALLIGTGLLFTIKTKFVQVRCFGEGLKQVFGNFSLKGNKNADGISSFQALAVAIAAQVGTGNIVGASGGSWWVALVQSSGCGLSHSLVWQRFMQKQCLRLRRVR